MNEERVTFKSGYVAIAGRPNVGKSTLLNNLLNFKVSSVTRKAQTTRHQIRGVLNGSDHQVIFLDTPGLLEPKYKLQEAMVQAATRSAKEADIILFLTTAQTTTTNSEELSYLQEYLQLKKHIIIIINKIDLVRSEKLLPLIEFYQNTFGLKTIIPVSALKCDGLDRVRNEIVAALPEGIPFYPKDQITDHPERFLVSEIIREKIFQRYSDEIPYSTTVRIDEFTEKPNRKDYIRAVIYVEKKSQKAILIGKKGVSLKEVGKTARIEIETVLGRSVFLELWVKIQEKWRRNEIILKEFGYYN